jgi:hypothetical protein
VLRRAPGLLAAALLLLSALAAGALEAQQVRGGPEGVIVGRILDGPDGSPLEGVEVGLNSARILAVTDQNGRFRLDPVPEGDHVLWARRIGYAERADSVSVPDRVLLDITMTLSTDPIELDELVVVVRSPVLEKHGFYARQTQGYDGIYLDRDEIQRRNPRAVTDLFRNMPSVRVVWGGIRGSRVFINQRVTFQDDGMPGCEPGLWLDGIRSTMTSYDMMRAEEIEGIEVYSGGAAPGKFSNICGTVAIWTRVPVRR